MDKQLPILALFTTFIVLLLVWVPSGNAENLEDDVNVYDIEPADDYEQSINKGDIATYVIVVKNKAMEKNVTIILSNESSLAGWNVQVSTEMFVLGHNGSQVVRINIWPDEYVQGTENTVELYILGIADSDSVDINRTYVVTVGTRKIIAVEKEDEKLDILGYEVDVPESFDSNTGRFAILLFFWGIVTLCVLMLMDPFIKGFTKRTKTEIDDIVLRIIRKPLLILLIIYGIVDSLYALEISDEVIHWIGKSYEVVFLLVVITTGYKLFKEGLDYVDRMAQKTSLGGKVHHALVPALAKIGSILFFFIGFNVILGYFGMDLALILGGMTLMGLVIAFAAQDTLSNFFGGMFLILEPNFKEGDTIILRDITYDVKEIGMRTTQLYDVSNHALVILPNNILANEKIVTLTEPDRKIKMSIEVGIAYGSDIDKVENILLSIAREHPEILADDTPPFVRFNLFGDSSLDFKLVFWVDDLQNRFRVRHEIMRSVYHRFNEENIQIPFPQRVVQLQAAEKTEASADLSSMKSSHSPTYEKESILEKEIQKEGEKNIDDNTFDDDGDGGDSGETGETGDD